MVGGGKDREEMTTANDIFNALEDAKAKVSKVFICNPKQKEILEKVTENQNNVFIIENSCVEMNKVFMVTDSETKKAIIRNCLKNRRLTE